MLYIMMKSQQNQYFSGAGFVDINFEAFESVRSICNHLNPVPTCLFVF